MPLQTALKVSQAEALFLIKNQFFHLHPQERGEEGLGVIKLDYKDYVIFKRVFFSVVLFYELLIELARLKNVSFDKNNIHLDAF